MLFRRAIVVHFVRILADTSLFMIPNGIRVFRLSTPDGLVLSGGSLSYVPAILSCPSAHSPSILLPPIASYISFSVQIAHLITEKLPQPSISLAYFTKKLYLCTRNDSRWGMWAGLCLPFAPAIIFHDIIKRRLLALVLVVRNPENFTRPKQG